MKTLQTKFRKFIVEGYTDGERFGEAGYRPSHRTEVRAETAEQAENRMFEKWKGAVDLVIAIETK